MRRNLIGLLSALFLFNSCKTEDPCEGLILDVISQTLVVELIDEDGNNLIENGTYNAETIYTERNGTKTIPVVYDESQLPNLPQELKNVIIINIFKFEEVDNTTTIHLNEQEVDSLLMDLEIESTGCSGTFYNILEIRYNQEEQSFVDIGNNYYKISITK